MTSITVHVPRQAAFPRGAAWGAWLFRKASIGLSGLFIARQARTESLRQTARIADANAVRRLAWSMVTIDPGFAADLYAAADRHELAD